MEFSDTFGIEIDPSEKWLDAFLSIDSELFIDRFLIYYFNRSGHDGGNIFEGSHADIIAYFGECFRLIAKSGGDTSSPYWARAKSLLMFPEVEELCLGYTSGGTRGSGSGRDISERLSKALWNSVLLGIEELRHFEEVQIFETGIGPDRISDATAGRLRHRFATYTELICSKYSVPTREVRYGKARYDFE